MLKKIISILTISGVLIYSLPKNNLVSACYTSCEIEYIQRINYLGYNEDVLGDIKNKLHVHSNKLKYSRDFYMWCLATHIKMIGDGESLTEVIRIYQDKCDLNNIYNQSFPMMLESLLNYYINSTGNINRCDSMILQKAIENGKNLMFSKIFENCEFSKLQDFNKLSLLKSFELMKSHSMFAEHEKRSIYNIINNLDNSSLGDDTNILLTFAMISKEKPKKIDALKKIFGGRSYEEIAQTDRGCDALTLYSNICRNRVDSLSALNAVFKGRSHSEIAMTEKGRKALISLSGMTKIKISEKLEPLQAIFNGRSYEQIAKDSQGRDALISFANIPHNVKEQIKALNAVFGDRDYDEIAKDKQGCNALICFARIPFENIPDLEFNSVTNKLNALEAVLRHRVSFKAQGVAERILRGLNI